MKKWLRLLFVSGSLFVSCQRAVDAKALSVRSWNKPQWIADALNSVLEGRYPRLKALSYWHESWQNTDGSLSDLRLNSSTEAAAAYKELAKNPQFITEPQLLFSAGMYGLDAPQKGIYLAAFPAFGSTEDQVTKSGLEEFESIAGHQVVWAYFSDNWYQDIKFPIRNVAEIQKAGRVPFIRMMMRSEDQSLPDSQYRLQQIIEGKFDKELKKWAEEAKLTQLPLMVEFGTEVNGDWFPWSGQWNGAGETDGFGDPNKPDGPERFQVAYRHIVGIFRAIEASNVSWAFHVNAVSFPKKSWNTIAAYYPGDEFVDWIGVSVYGPQKANSSAGEPFSRMLDRVYPELTALSLTKPIAVLEWGIAEPGKKGRR